MSALVAEFADTYADMFPAAVKVARRLGARDPENVAAEALACVLDAMHKGREFTNMRAYVSACVRNEATTQGKQAAREQLTGDTYPFDNRRVTEAAEHDRHMRAAFATLDKQFRWVLQQTVFQGLKPADIAAATNLTPNTVSALAYRARKQLAANYQALIAEEA